MTTDLAGLRRVAREEELTRASATHALAHLAASWTCACTVGVLALLAHHWAAWIVAWPVLAWLLVGNGAIVHEAVHGHLFDRRALDEVAGTLAGATLLLPWGTYRAYHLEHHRSATTPEDPEGEPMVFTSRLQYLALLPLGGPLFIGELLVLTARALLRRGPRWVRTDGQRREIVRSASATFLVACLLVVLAVRWPGELVRLWLVPYALALGVLLPMVLYPEHADGRPDPDPLRNTRTIRSNALVRFVFWNANLHAEHHAIPAVTWRGLPRLSEELGDDRDPAWRAPSYLAFHRARLRALPLLPRRARV